MIMKTTLLAITLLTAISTMRAQPFAYSFGSAGQEYGKAAALDSAGNVIIAGLYQNTIDFDAGAAVANLTSFGAVPTVDTVLTKYDSSGNFLWAKSIGGAGTNVPHAVAVDAADNIYFAGYFGMPNGAPVSADFNPGAGVTSLTNSGGFDPCLAKYDSNGNLLWARTWGNTSTSTTEERAWDIAVAPTGEVYVTGFVHGTYNLNGSGGTNIYTSAGGSDAFLAKYDASGNHVWSFGLGTAGEEEGLGVALDNSGHVFLNGYFSNTLDTSHGSGTGNLSSTGSSDLFVARYDATTGDYQKSIRIGGTLAETAPPGSMRVGPDGDLYLTGRFRGVVDLDPGTAVHSVSNTGTGATDEIFVASYDADLAYRWGFNVASGGELDGAHRVGFDASGHLYIAGWFSEQADFDGGIGTALVTSLGTGGASDLFLAKYNAADGSFIWVDSFGALLSGSTNQSIVAGLAVAPDGSAYITGQYYGATDFDPSSGTFTLTPLGQNDLFLAKYGPNGNLATVPEPGVAGMFLLAGITMLLPFRKRFRVSAVICSCAMMVNGVAQEPLRGNTLMSKIEVRLGQPLTPDQRRQFLAATTESKAGLREKQINFVRDIASITGLPQDEIAAMMPKIGESNEGFDKNMIPKIESKLGRKLSPGELAGIRKADQEKKDGMKPVREKLIQSISGFTGLTPDEVGAMLPKVGL